MKYLALLIAAASSFIAMAQTSTVPDTIYVVKLDNHDLNSTRKWANDTLAYRYNQMRYYVTTVMPYVNAATTMFSEIDSKLNSNELNRHDRKQYIAQQEGRIRNEFEDKVTSLNTTQGVLLIKLIARQTGLNIYDIIQETKGTMNALKYQTWARFNGLNLNRRYHAEDEPDLERIMTKLGYPLRADLAAAVQ